MLLRAVSLNVLPDQCAWGRLTQRTAAIISLLLHSLEKELLECLVKCRMPPHLRKIVESSKRSVLLDILPKTLKYAMVQDIKFL